MGTDFLYYQEKMMRTQITNKSNFEKEYLTGILFLNIISVYKLNGDFNMSKGKNEGITLIALVITIIVLLILVGISLSLITGEEGLIGRTISTKEIVELSEVLDNLKIEVIASYDNDGKLNVDTVRSNILNNVQGISEVEGTQFPLIIKTEKGKKYLLKENGEIIEKYWFKQDDGTYTDGKVVLKIGDYISYDHTKNSTGETINGQNAEYTSYSETNSKESLNSGRTNGNTSDCNFSLSAYTGGWRVLGVENGKLKLIAEKSIGNLSLRGQKGYIYGIDELNAISSIYGNGKGAESAKSVTVEDINEITKYNPELTGDGEVRAKGKMWEYGNVVTYFWQNGKVKCTATNGKSYTSTNTVFKYYDKDKNGFIDLAKDKSIELTSRSYNYYPVTLTESSSGTPKGIETSSLEYKLLFNSKYWLASSFIGTGEGNVGFGIFQLDTTRVYDSNLCDAINQMYTLTLGIRPVIILSKDVNVIKNEAKDGTTKAKACIIEK